MYKLEHNVSDRSRHLCSPITVCTTAVILTYLLSYIYLLTVWLWQSSSQEHSFLLQKLSAAAVHL